MSAGRGSEPWREVEAWEGGVVGDGTKKSLITYWWVAGLWVLMTLPIPLIIWMDPEGRARLPEEWAAMPLYGHILYLLWFALGIYTIYQAGVATARARRFRQVELELDPFPGSLGGQAGGSVQIPVRRDTDLDARVKLSCIYRYVTSSGDDREHHTEVLWSDEVVPEVERSPLGVELHFVFDVPDDDLPESELSTGGKGEGSRYWERRYWAMRVHARFEGADLDKEFEVPVYRVQPPLQASRSFEPPEVALLDLADSGVVARKTPDGLEIDYLRGRWGSMGWGVGVAGVAFAVAAAMTWYTPRANDMSGFNVFLGSVFGVLIALPALALLLSGAHMMLSRRRLRVEDGILTVGSWWFLKPSEEELALSEIAWIVGEAKSRQGSGTDQVRNYVFHAVPRDGEKILVGDGIRGTYLANRIATVLDEATGVEVKLQ